jgi:hypothetical protein
MIAATIVAQLSLIDSENAFVWPEIRRLQSVHQVEKRKSYELDPIGGKRGLFAVVELDVHDRLVIASTGFSDSSDRSSLCIAEMR